MSRKYCAIFLFLLMVLLSVPVSAEKAAPLRIARLPIIVQSSFNLSAETVAELETKVDRALHVPLNGVLQKVEYLPEQDCMRALDDVMAELRRTNRKAKLKDAMKPLAERLGADLVVCPVIEHYSQYISMGFHWNGESILYSDVRISLAGYERGKDKPFLERESRFYRNEYSNWGLARVLAGECMDKVIDRTGIYFMVHDSKE